MPAYPWKIVTFRGKEVTDPGIVDVNPDDQLPIRLLQAYCHNWRIVPTGKGLYSRRFFEETNAAEHSRREILRQAIKGLFKKFRQPTIHHPLYVPVLTRVNATPDLNYPFRILMAYRDLFSVRKPVTDTQRRDMMRRGAINRAILVLRRSDPWKDLSYPFLNVSFDSIKDLVGR